MGCVVFHREVASTFSYSLWEYLHKLSLQVPFFFVVTHLILSTVLLCRYYYYPHLQDKKTKAQNGY